MNKRLATLALCATLGIALAACSKGELLPVIHVPTFERQQITGRVCAPPPREEDAPYRVLFVIDTSGSNSDTDPEGRRGAAVQGVIDRFMDEPLVSFGVITFDTDAHTRTFGFTRDMGLLRAAVDNVNEWHGGTNYAAALEKVRDFITTDLSLLSAVEAARTHYSIHWVSDGEPMTGETDSAILASGVTLLMNLVQGRVAEISFNTYYLTPPTANPGEQVATELLQDFARLGNGEFGVFQGSATIEFEIQLATVLTRFDLAVVYASNIHTLLGPEGPEPDSDADGIADAFELQLGLAPDRADSDGDGYRDGVEYFTQGMLHPLEFDAGCDKPELDADADGLTDCEELALGTLPHNPDTDGDLVPDGVEVLNETSPLLDDTEEDNDLDKTSNGEEIRFHLDPRMPNSQDQAKTWGYRYRVQHAVDTDFEGPPCYQITVDNLTMAETLETAQHPRGGNVIDVLVGFRGGSSTRFLRAELRGRVLYEQDYWDPPGGVFKLTEQDFAPLGE